MNFKKIADISFNFIHFDQLTTLKTYSFRYFTKPVFRFSILLIANQYDKRSGCNIHSCSMTCYTPFS